MATAHGPTTITRSPPRSAQCQLRHSHGAQPHRRHTLTTDPVIIGPSVSVATAVTAADSNTTATVTATIATPNPLRPPPLQSHHHAVPVDRDCHHGHHCHPHPHLHHHHCRFTPDTIVSNTASANTTIATNTPTPHVGEASLQRPSSHIWETLRP